MTAYYCGGCARLIDADERPSPGEGDEICADCWDTDDMEESA